jgi:hypothetical protein
LEWSGRRPEGRGLLEALGQYFFSDIMS